jgi:chemotaxis family two-component system response regulator Rcp1
MQMTLWLAIALAGMLDNRTLPQQTIMGAAHSHTVEILLVEDSPSDAELTIESLKNLEVRSRVSTVEDGLQAMEFLRREGRYVRAPRPGLILLDLKMPRKDGREVLEDLARDPDLSRIPVAVMTASQATRDLLHAYRLNALFYLTKPVDTSQLAKLLNNLKTTKHERRHRRKPDQTILE